VYLTQYRYFICKPFNKLRLLNFPNSQIYYLNSELGCVLGSERVFLSSSEIYSKVSIPPNYVA
jgi:hypothetical protein